jgi:hypothetical protein
MNTQQPREAPEMRTTTSRSTWWACPKNISVTIACAQHKQVRMAAICMQDQLCFGRSVLVEIASVYGGIS